MVDEAISNLTIGVLGQTKGTRLLRDLDRARNESERLRVIADAMAADPINELDPKRSRIMTPFIRDS